MGNDVVDLRDPDATPVSAPRFDARVFSASERAELDELDAAGEPRRRRRWQLWAAKEAAYKLRVKRDADVVFAPSRFRTRLGAPGARLEGDVEACGVVSRVVVEDADDAVHAVASDGGARVISGVARLGADRLDPKDPHAPGREARRFATERIARALGRPAAGLEIRKRGRVPVLWLDGEAHADVSLSHHGQVVAFACALPAATAAQRESGS